MKIKMKLNEAKFENLSKDRQRKLKEIHTQIQFLEQLITERLNVKALEQFAENQKYGKDTDEYKQIMQVYHNDKLDPRIQSSLGISDYPTWKEDDFTDYDANTYKDYVICSGPKSKDSVKDFIDNICMNTNNKRRAIDTIILFGKADQPSGSNSNKDNYFNYLVTRENLYGKYKVECFLNNSDDQDNTNDLLHYTLNITQRPAYNDDPPRTKKVDVYQFINCPQLSNLSVNAKDLLLNIAHRKPEMVAFQDDSGFSSAASLLLSFRIINKFYIIASGSDEKIKENLMREFRNFRNKRPGVLQTKETFIQAISFAFDLQQRYLLRAKENVVSDAPRSHETSDEDYDSNASINSSPSFSSSTSSSPTSTSSIIAESTLLVSSRSAYLPTLSIPIHKAEVDNKGELSSILGKSPPTPPFLLSPRGNYKIRTVGIIVTCDTKSIPAAELRRLLMHQGNIAIHMIDIGVKPVEPKPFPIAIETSELLLDDAPDLSVLGTINRPAAMNHIKQGIQSKILKIHEQIPFDVIIGFGGTTGSEIAVTAMRKLPQTVRKVLITTAPEIYKDDDIYCIKPHCDIGNVLNEPLNKSILDAVIYVQGSFNVVEKNSPKIDHKMSVPRLPTLGITQFGTSTPLVQAVSEHFSKDGYAIKAYHAKGEGGGKEMEEEIRKGTIDVVCDVTLSEVVAEIVGGPWRAGINRMLAAASKGLPTVIVPGCIDMFIVDQVSLSTNRYKGRLIRKCTEAVTVVRTNIEEYKKVATHITTMVKNSKAPVIILIPTKGFSAFDSETDDWKADNKEKGCWYKDFRLDDNVFVQNLREQITQLQNERRKSGIDFPPIYLREFKCNINDPLFAIEVIKATKEVIDLHKKFQSQNDLVQFQLESNVINQESQSVPSSKLRTSARSLSSSGLGIFGKTGSAIEPHTRRLSAHLLEGNQEPSEPSPQTNVTSKLGNNVG